MTDRTAYILTHHWPANFGANLQAYATLQALTARGVDVRFVDFRPPKLVQRYEGLVSADQRAAHEAFVVEHLPQTERIERQQGFLRIVGAAPADIYVSGSDAVFRVSATIRRPDFVFPNPYWLVGAAGPNGALPVRIAFAPSAMGCRFSQMSAADRTGMRAALEAFDHLSARDPWTVTQIASVGCGSEVTLVPDPVFTLTTMIRDQRVRTEPGKPYVVLGTQMRCTPRWIETFTRRAESEGFETVAIPNPEGQTDVGTSRSVDLPLAPFDWMAILAGSSGYIGGRFHPVVVSLVAGAPVVALDLYHDHPLLRRRSKTWLLMHEFGIERDCHARWLHPLLSPDAAWLALERQRSRESARRAMADRLTTQVEAFLDRAIGTPARHPGRMTAPVSCIVTSYNNAATLAATVRSVLRQSLPVAEIIIADDGSTDGSRDIIAALARDYPVISTVLRPRNLGVAANRDLAVRAATQPFVTHVDGDDLFGRHKIRAEWRALAGREDTVAYSTIGLFHPRQWWRTSVLDPRETVDAPIERTLENLLARRGAIPRDMLLAKSLFEQAGGFDHHRTLYEDWEFKLRLAAIAKRWVPSGALGTVYIQREGSLSRAAAARHEAARRSVAEAVLPLVQARMEAAYLAGALAEHFETAEARAMASTSRLRRRRGGKGRLERATERLRSVPMLIDTIRVAALAAA